MHKLCVFIHQYFLSLFAHVSILLFIVWSKNYSTLFLLYYFSCFESTSENRNYFLFRWTKVSIGILVVSSLQFMLFVLFSGSASLMYVLCLNFFRTKCICDQNNRHLTFYET
ncbi:unnamed protein product [Phytomonas sp. EM1]|nr:unnamed protein product [Phytomonas sp. EM1]|eukprot:CCW63128.1 unnamed protein product [Phytomonas sp. isolate EM1]